MALILSILLVGVRAGVTTIGLTSDTFIGGGPHVFKRQVDQDHQARAPGVSCPKRDGSLSIADRESNKTRLNPHGEFVD